MNVFILARCRNPELFGATRMVFDTLRVGFPSAKVKVFECGNSKEHQADIVRLCKEAGAEVSSSGQAHEHPNFIEALLEQTLVGPFVLCDTDMMFWDEVQGMISELAEGSPLAGRYVPKFYDEFTKAITMPRLHTSLLAVNPRLLREAVTRYRMAVPQTVYNPCINLFRSVYVPTDQGRLFYDGGALLYQALGGRRFSTELLERYDHLHCGTISDLVAPHLTLGKDMMKHNLELIANPQAARGIWRQQEQYYAEFAIH